MDFPKRVFARLVPALLLAAGVALIAGGLLSYAPSVVGDPEPSAGPTLSAGDPLFTPGPGAPSPSLWPDEPTPSPSDGFFPSPTIPLASGGLPTTEPSPRPTVDPTTGGHDAVASRIRIPSLRIDLPVVSGELVVRGNRDAYPLCDVAQYLTFYSQPGEPGATYIYAHAQRGMFLPLLRASQRDGGAELIGALVEVFTTDNRLHMYQIYRVKRHSTDLAIANNVPPGEERLVLQTSEGFAGHPQKLQVAARPIAVFAATRQEANPTPDPRVCLPPR